MPLCDINVYSVYLQQCINVLQQLTEEAHAGLLPEAGNNITTTTAHLPLW